MSQDGGACIPDDISREEYMAVKANPDAYPDWYVGMVGFCSSFGGKWMAGYAGRYKGTGRSRVNEMLRNLKKQAPSLKGIQFDCRAYRDICVPEGSLVYIDPPYRSTTAYKGTPAIDYEDLYDWIRAISQKCKVFVSEYQMPPDFKVVAEFPQLTQLCNDKSKQFTSVEKVFTL